MSQETGPLVALTGATGFLGRALVQELAAKGCRVRILVRSFPFHAQLSPCRLELVPGDLDDKAALQRLTSDADAVVHLAGAIKGSARRLMHINGQGTRHIVAAWRENSPKARFINVSSMTAREPHLSAYAASKKAAEDAVTSIDADWLVVRPSAVYGPWDTETLSIFKAAHLPIHPMLNGDHARLSLIHVVDAARALAALCDERPKEPVLELCDGAPKGYSWPQIVQAACTASNTKARPVSVPPGLVITAAILNAKLARLCGKVSIFDEGKAREILHPDWATYPRHRIPQTIWTPEITLEKGFEQTTKWYQDAGWL